MPVRLGEMLLKENMITPQQLQEALTHQKQNGGKLGQGLCRASASSRTMRSPACSRGSTASPRSTSPPSRSIPPIIKILPAETCRKYQVIPISRAGAMLTLAMTDPTNVFAMDDIKFMTGYNVEPVVASEIALEEAIDRFYGSAPAR